MKPVVGALVAALAPMSVGSAAGEPAALAPATVPFPDDSHSRQIAALVEDAIEAGQMSGCVVLIGRGDEVHYHRAFGHRALEPAPEPMRADTLFDLASLTKPVATATSVLLLHERGLVDLDRPVCEYLPDFGQNGKEEITVRQLLLHTGGLIPDNSLADYDGDRRRSFERIHRLEPRAEPGTKFIYSDVGFLVLGELVEHLGGQPLDVFARENVFEPLGMHETTFLPPAELRARAAVTEQRDGEWLRGVVHDPRSHRLGGVAGHAGLFSTAADLSRYARALLGDGRLEDTAVMSPETVRKFMEPQRAGRASRALGWDVRSRYSSNRGDGLSDRAVGHGGFTGTGLWLDPESDLFVVFLGSRLHPDGEGTVNPLIGEIGGVAAAWLGGSAQARVRTGIDVLLEENFARLSGRRVGLITNRTGRAADGRSTVQCLEEAPGVELAALFSPEHGLFTTADGVVADSVLAGTEIPVYSLYGEDRRKPTARQLEGLDTLVFDVQDIGTRFYTYISTLGLALEAAAENGLSFVVLDRPNPINGVDVAGPLRDEDAGSFVAYHPLVIRHGMTVGELARMFRAERDLDVELEVVAMEGWSRDRFFDETGLAWVDPSPNIRRPMQALLYPGIGLLEFTNLSVGRGTDTPFERIGAPWLDGRRLAAALAERRLPGVSFVPVEFTPSSSKFARERCGGILIEVLDREGVRPLRIGLEIAVQLRGLYPGAWRYERMEKLLCHRRTLDELRAGRPAEELLGEWRTDEAAFSKRRLPFLIYPMR